MTRGRSWRPTAWPMPLLSVLVPSAAVVTVVGFGVTELFTMPIGWPRTSAAVHDLSILAGPIAAMAAHFYCASVAGRDSLLALTNASRAGLPSVLRSFALLLAWMLTAYLVPLIPLLVYTAADATYGMPDVLAALAGPVGMALAVALGCALGTILPYPVLAPGVGVLVFLLFQLPNFIAAAAFVPTLGYLIITGVFENPAFAFYRLATMAVLTVFALGAAGLVARGARGAELVTWRSGIATLTAVVLVAVPLVNPPRVVLAEEAPPRVCEQVSTVEVCMHQGHSKLLRTVVPVVRKLLDAYGKPPVHLQAVHDSGLLRATEQPGVMIAQVTPYTTGAFDDLVAERVSNHLAGQAACLASDPTGLQYQEVAGRVTRLAVWLRQTAGVADEQLPPAAGGFLGGGTRAEVKAWIAEHEQALATCQPVREVR